MRKLNLVLTLALTISISTVTAMATQSPSIIIDNTPVQFNTSLGYPFIDSNDRTQVPMRAVMESYGCIVDWIAETNTATVQKGQITVSIPVGKQYIIRNGKTIPNDTTSVTINERLYLPIRAVLEAFGATVNWDNANNTVHIIKDANGAISDNKEATNNNSGTGNSSTNNSGNGGSGITTPVDPTGPAESGKFTVSNLRSDFSTISIGKTQYVYQHKLSDNSATSDNAFNEFFKYWDTVETVDLEQAMIVFAREEYKNNNSNGTKTIVISVSFRGAYTPLASVEYNPIQNICEFTRQM